MNEQIRSILAQETTKTSKIRQLFLLGVPRAEIAMIMQWRSCGMNFRQ